jgi:hypothetical protein
MLLERGREDRRRRNAADPAVSTARQGVGGGSRRLRQDHLFDESDRQFGYPAPHALTLPRVIAGRESDGAPVTDPHAEAARGTLPSLFNLLVVFADTVLSIGVQW